MVKYKHVQIGNYNKYLRNYQFLIGIIFELQCGQTKDERVIIFELLLVVIHNCRKLVGKFREN